MDGILIVHKEQGFTSHDVVAKLRGILHQKKIGHTGTLDPDATGVLPVCLGNATRVCDLLTDTDKVYRGRMLLGLSTDTEDVSGCICTDTSCAYTQEEIRQAFAAFCGTYAQIPPMYAAIKVDGKRMYDYARQGIPVDRHPRSVRIDALQVEEIHTVTGPQEAGGRTDNAQTSDGMKLIGEDTLPANTGSAAGDTNRFPGIFVRQQPQAYPKQEICFTVHCSKGTYVRALCRDIGLRLGTGGCLSALERTKAGYFTLAQAHTFAQIEAAASEETLQELVIPVDTLFASLPAIHTDTRTDRLLRNGNPLPFSLLPAQVSSQAAAGQSDCRVYDEKGKFTAIYRCDPQHARLRPVKMFL